MVSNCFILQTYNSDFFTRISYMLQMCIPTYAIEQQLWSNYEIYFWDLHTATGWWSSIFPEDMMMMTLRDIKNSRCWHNTQCTPSYYRKQSGNLWFIHFLTVKIQWVTKYCWNISQDSLLPIFSIPVLCPVPVISCVDDWGHLLALLPPVSPCGTTAMVSYMKHKSDYLIPSDCSAQWVRAWVVASG